MIRRIHLHHFGGNQTLLCIYLEAINFFLYEKNMKHWLIKFPRLNQLYERIGPSEPNNVIAGYIEWGKLDSLVLNDAEWLEGNLVRLEPKAWEDLIVKLRRYSCSKQKSSGRRQFWELLNELRGYVLLKDRGYSEIDFIPEENEKRADLIGKSPTRVILEVKTINRSDDDRERERKRTDPIFSARKKVGKYERRGDIIDLSAFANKLSKKSDPISTFLWEQLDKSTQELLANYASDTEQVECMLVENLNQIIKRQRLYEEECFRGKISQDDFMEHLMLCEYYVGLNRCLLDDAYPQELSNWSRSVRFVEVAPPPDVAAPIPVKLLEKCEKTIKNARCQIATTLKDMPPVEKKIVLLIINRDFGCSFITIKQLEVKLHQEDLEVVCQVGGF
jgi:hypothetical protein